MSAMASRVTSLTIVYSTVHSGADQRQKTPRHCPLWEDFTVDRWIPHTKASNAENSSILWRHHHNGRNMDLYPYWISYKDDRKIAEYLLLNVISYTSKTKSIVLKWGHEFSITAVLSAAIVS